MNMNVLMQSGELYDSKLGLSVTLTKDYLLELVGTREGDPPPEMGGCNRALLRACRDMVGVSLLVG